VPAHGITAPAVFEHVVCPVTNRRAGMTQGTTAWHASSSSRQVASAPSQSSSGPPASALATFVVWAATAPSIDD
jgi:hypothetical protein